MRLHKPQQNHNFTGHLPEVGIARAQATQVETEAPCKLGTRPSHYSNAAARKSSSLITCWLLPSACLRPALTAFIDEQNTTSVPLAAKVAPNRRGQGMFSSFDKDARDSGSASISSALPSMPLCVGGGVKRAGVAKKKWSCTGFFFRITLPDAS